MMHASKDHRRTGPIDFPELCTGGSADTYSDEYILQQSDSSNSQFSSVESSPVDSEKKLFEDVDAPNCQPQTPSTALASRPGDDNDQVGPRPSTSGFRTSQPPRPKYDNSVVTGAADMTMRESLFPLAMFFLASASIGFSGGLSSNQSKAFQNAFNLTRGQSTGLDIGYFTAFLVTPLTLGAFLTRRYGYKTAVCTALALKSIGHLGYWPSSAYRYFAGFCIAAFINGVGTAISLTAIVPYVANCGPRHHAETRLLLCNVTFHATYLLAEVCMTFVVYGRPYTTARDALAPICWTHVASAGVLALAAAVLAAVRVREITDADVQAVAQRSAGATGWVDRPLRRQTRLWVGVWGCFFYDGACVAMQTFFMNFVEDVLPAVDDRTAAGLNVLASGLGVLSKLAVGLAVRVVRPRVLVAWAFALCLVLVSVALGVGGVPAAVLFILDYTSRAPVSVLMYALAYRGLGRRLKLGSAILTSTIGAGAIVTPLCGWVSDRVSLRYAMGVPLGGFVLASVFAVYVNTFEAQELDQTRKTEKAEADVAAAQRDSTRSVDEAARE